MWRAIEEYGIDRKFLEMTDPGEELVEKMYRAISEIRRRELEISQIQARKIS